MTPGRQPPIPGREPHTVPDWPVAFFDDDYIKIYKPLFTSERTAAEVDFIASTLDLAKGARVLDLACGFGRHAIGMAGRGHVVTGLDFNQRYLDIAAGEAKRAGVEIAWMKGDMRKLAFDASFDAVYSYFTSFGYFEDDENEQVMAGVTRALRPGGKLLMEMLNRDYVLVHPEQRTWHQREDGALLMEEVKLDLETSRVVSRQMLIDPKGGPEVIRSYDLRAYTCGELRAMMGRHGLTVDEVWGGIDRSAYSADSRRLAILAHKEGRD